ncbi:MAG: hypothetical protein HYV19_04725 [Gemmatimonadetes bacterium]|nr:hypothetical protein [Gemmatimonadota bacterium]
MFRASKPPTFALSLALAASACAATATSLSPNEIAGTYRLVSIYGMPLPAQSVPGRVTVDSGSIEVGAGGDMRRDEFGTSCSLGTCTAFHEQFLAQWTLARGNRLLLSYSTGGVDSSYVASPGNIISTYVSGSKTAEAKRWEKR